MFEPPQNWEEFQRIANEAIKNIETIRGTPLPKSLKEAVDGNFLEASGDVLEETLGYTPKGEMREWGKRVMSLKAAHEILRGYEKAMVRAFVLSAESPARLIYNGLVRIPRWVMEHLAEITLILWPLILTALEAILDGADIETKIEEQEKRIARLQKRIAELYEETPGSGMTIKKDAFGNEYLDGDGRTAKEIESDIKVCEDGIAEAKRLISDYTKMLRQADAYLEMAVVGVAVLLAWFSVEHLLQTVSSVKDVLMSLKPAKELRDKAMAEIKAVAFPQRVQLRQYRKKRSRRN